MDEKNKEIHDIMKETGTALLEIGTEELPPQFFFDACEQLSQLFEKKLAEKRLSYEKLSVEGTPRRLTAQIYNLISQQPDQTKEVKGPSKSAAYDSNGNPSHALMGFAKSQGVSLDLLQIKEFSGKPYIFATVHEKGELTSTLLSKIFPEVIQALTFPKAMKWDGKFTFGRPVRWIVALFENEIIPFKIVNLASSSITFGHRFLSKGPIVINHPSEYIEKLNKGFVIPETKKRMDLIQTQIKDLAETVSAQVYPTNTLIEEVNLLVEYPTAFIGNFAPEFLSLPEEVLVTVMQHHQRYFPLVSLDGKLLPYFIAVRNGDSEGIDEVRKGNEQVLKARFKDAQYFFENDKKRKLLNRQKDLSKLVFQKNLGTMEQKVERLKVLTDYLSKKLQNLEQLETLPDIVNLSKCDLTTQMVFEFTELQGVMGKEYARLEGYPEIVSQGILDHYLPRYQGDSYPKTLPGAVLGIADRIDTLVGCFGLNLQPKGSSDPLGLRRAAAALLQIIIEKELNIDLMELTAEAEKQYRNQGFNLKQFGCLELENFILDRCETVWKAEGIRYDLFRSFDQAVSGQGESTQKVVSDFFALPVFTESTPRYILKKPFHSFQRAKFLETTREKEKEKFPQFTQAWVRVFNILKSKEAEEMIKKTAEEYPNEKSQTEILSELKINPELFHFPEEKSLYDHFQKHKSEITVLLEKGETQKGFELLSSFQNPIHSFFDKVLVMDPEENLRKNRILFLWNLMNLMQESFGDLTQVVMD